MKEKKILTKLGIIFGVIALILILIGVLFFKPKTILAETPDSFLMNELYLFNRDTFNINPNFENGYLMKTTILPSDIESDTQSSFFGWYHSLGYRNLIIPYYGSDNDNIYVVFGIPLNGITASNFQIAYSVDTPTLLDFYLIFTDGTYEEWNTEDYGFNMYIDVSNVNREKNCYAFCWEAYSPDYIPSFKNFSVSDGYDLGYQHGQTTGFESGFNSGYNNGYNAGFQDGINNTEQVIYEKILEFNQLIINGNFINTSNWILTGGSSVLNFSVNENVGIVTYLDTQQPTISLGLSTTTLNVNTNDKLYYKFKMKCDNTGEFKFVSYYNYALHDIEILNINDEFQEIIGIYTAPTNTISFRVQPISPDDFLSTNDKSYFKEYQIFNLTKMYGAGFEPSIEQCESIFYNDYYEYTLGQPLDIGYYTGYYEGKNEGIQEGINIGETNQINMNWIQSIFQAMQGFFNIQIFPRVTLGIIVGIPFIISLAWFVIKMFRGGGGGED